MYSSRVAAPQSSSAFARGTRQIKLDRRRSFGIPHLTSSLSTLLRRGRRGSYGDTRPCSWSVRLKKNPLPPPPPQAGEGRVGQLRERVEQSRAQLGIGPR